MPRHPPVWQANLLSHPQQAQMDLQQELCRRFHFTPDDWFWNRQGRFSPAQQALVARADRRRRNLWLFYVARLALLLLGGYSYYLFQPNVNAFVGAAFQGGNIPGLLGFFSLIYIVYPVLGLGLLFIPHRGYFPSAAQVRAGVVTTAEGALESYEKSFGDFPSDWYYRIDTLDFKINGKQLSDLNGIRSRLHYAPALRPGKSPGVIMSIELLEPPHP